jgi:hypothetical protein
MLMAATPWLESTWAVVLALTIAVTFLANAISLNAVLCNDLVRNSGNASKALALFTSGANVVGVTAPIVTGYIVSSSKAFDVPSCLPARCWCSARSFCWYSSEAV